MPDFADNKYPDKIISLVETKSSTLFFGKNSEI